MHHTRRFSRDCPYHATDARLREVNAVYLDEIRKSGLYDDIWQAFAVLLPVRTVGVMGDGRLYDQACALRAVTSNDGMTADDAPFDHAFLGRVASCMISEVRRINRVTYDIASKPPGTIECERKAGPRVSLKGRMAANIGMGCCNCEVTTISS